MAKHQPKIDYQSYVVKKEMDDYWRAEEKVQLILFGLTGKLPVTTLARALGLSRQRIHFIKKAAAFETVPHYAHKQK